jgi:hypothetical protein
MMDAYMRFRAVLCKTAKIRLKSRWLLEGLWCGQLLGSCALPCTVLQRWPDDTSRTGKCGVGAKPRKKSRLAAADARCITFASQGHF